MFDTSDDPLDALRPSDPGKLFCGPGETGLGEEVVVILIPRHLGYGIGPEHWRAVERQDATGATATDLSRNAAYIRGQHRCAVCHCLSDDDERAISAAWQQQEMRGLVQPGEFRRIA